jgi:uncharacterized Zn finger protein
VQLVFEIQGSAATPYRVTFENRGEGKLAGFCTCPAGQAGQYCKHRLSILAGSAVGVVSGNEPEVQIAVSWLKGSGVERCLREFHEAEQKLETAKRDVTRAKQAVAQALRG